MAAPQKGRKSPRAQVSLVARYRSPTAFEFVKEECCDLSAGGMFIKSPAPAPAGTLIKLECDVDHGTKTIRGVARVVWLRELDSEGQPSGMGVKFVKLDAGGREAIHTVLLQLGAEHGEPEAIEAARSTPPNGSDAEPFARTPSAAPRKQAAPDVRGATAATDESAPTGAQAAGPAPTPPAPTDASDLARLDAPFTKGPSDARGLAPTARPQSSGARGLAPAARPGPSDPRGLASATRAGSLDTQRLGPVSGSASSDAQGLAPAAHAAPSDARALSAALQGKPSSPPASAARQGGARPALPGKKAEPGGAAVAKAGPKGTPKPASKAGARGSQPLPARQSAAPGGRARALIYAVVVALAGAGLYAMYETQHTDDAPLPAAVATTQTPAALASSQEGIPAANAEPQPPSMAQTPPIGTNPSPTGSLAAAPRYVLEIVTTPQGARVTAGDRSLSTPGTLDLGTLAEPVQLTAEMPGFQTVTAVVDRVAFMLDEGQMRRRIALTLVKEPPPELAPSAAVDRARHKPTSATPRATRNKPAASTGSVPSPEGESTPGAKTTEVAAEAKPQAAQASIAPAQAAHEANAPAPKDSTKQTAMEAATACLAAGDSACAVKALEGDAKSAPELELLIETYRAMGSADKADQEMQVYLGKYPTARRANGYRRVLERRQNEAQPAH